MAHGLNSSKSFARPARQAIEKASENSIDSFQSEQRRMSNSEQRRMSNLALRLARRAQNRLIDNEGKLPGSTLFSK